MITVTLIATLIALVAMLLSPKRYLSAATALPVNSLVADKARIFSSNIQALYSDFGTPDELDRMEGTAALDTVFIAAANHFHLAGHYGLRPSAERDYKAALKLKRNTKVNRTAYGELKIKVWDKDPVMAAALANSIMENIQELHQHLQNESNSLILGKVKEDYDQKEAELKKLADSSTRISGVQAEIGAAKRTALLDQLGQYEKMMNEYQLAMNTNPPVLLTVERARPSYWPDRSDVLPVVLLSFFAAFVFSFLAALFMESRNMKG